MRRTTNFDITQPFGGRLQDYTNEWIKNFGYQLATKIVQWGYKPIWNSYPPLSTPPISHYISDFDAMEQEISRLLDEEIIRRFVPRNQCFLSKVNLKRKENGDYRLVPNFRYLNYYVQQFPLTMEGMGLVEELIQQNDYMISIDLKEAFYHIPLHPDAQKYFVFDFNYERYCFQCLPFGLKTSSWTFKTVLQPIIESIRLNGIRIVAYCDDILIFSRTKHGAKRYRDSVINLLESHGFIINERKSQLTPRRSIEYLGYVINSVQMMIAAPKEKIEKLRDECINIYNQHFIQLRSLTSLISKLYNIVKDPECTRELRRDERLHQRRNQNSRIQLSQRARQELEDWIDNIEDWNGYFIITT
ncbi:28676_t:CDS:1 [Gigaspora margarita]|uniref:28676_t:CDS:1 n=1 Tax=Gigaspora margarita TaxID=4874 RepID=A0ABN7ULD9_GIGMA|nr:28676_t:CDS:1 [Gigaspora margarita]